MITELKQLLGLGEKHSQALTDIQAKLDSALTAKSDADKKLAEAEELITAMRSDVDAAKAEAKAATEALDKERASIKEQVEKLASARALEITAGQGQQKPLPQTAVELPSKVKPDLSKLTGLDKTIAAFRLQMAKE
jgi:predicted  nucleic acid-binding Zn-ribbon protein